MKTQTAIRAVIAGIGVALAAIGTTHGQSEDPSAQAPPTTSTAEAILAQARTTLQSAKTLQADFEEVDSYPAPYKDLAQRGTITEARDSELRIDIKRFRRVTASDPWTPSGNDAISVSDGTTYTYAFLHPHSTQVRQEAASSKAIGGALRLVPPAAGFFGRSFLDKAADTASLSRPAVWEGAAYDVVKFQVPIRPGSGGQDASADSVYDATAYIGADHIVHRLVYEVQNSDGPVIKEWTLRNVQIDSPVPASTFAYAPPADATPLDTSSRAPLLAAGTVAPDFTVTDPHGNPVKLSDYRGHTVVLDFWATWCWPCNQSLPHTDAVVKENHDRGVVALAVAIWDSRPGFDAWIAKHNYPNIQFAFDPNPQGKDVGSSLYHVGATPTAYIIGPDGKIASTIVGYAGPTKDLQAAIATATTSQSAKAAL